MKKKWLSLLLVICLLLYIPHECRATEIKDSELYARSACLLDADSGRVLYNKNAYEQMPMASTTKIMTCILALELAHLDDVVTVSANAVSQPPVKMNAQEGEQFLLSDLLYALMLNSYNDVAVMVAEHVGGSVEAFAEKMNLKARELGCEDTYFITPSGLDAQDAYGQHSTTAVDLAKIMKYCITESPQKELFLEITRMPSYTFWNQSQTQSYNCTNHNSFLTMMDGALTGKTGFTSQAGYCYVGALEWEGKTFVVSLLACGWPNNKGYKWSDTKKLMLYGLRNYEYEDVFKHEELELVEVENGICDDTQIGQCAEVEVVYGIDQEDITYDVLLKQDEEVEVVYQIPDSIEAPVLKGQQIGTVQYFLNGELLREYPVYAKNEVKERDYFWCLEKIKEAYQV
ncbi:MAG: D-alanyl-D-alanine carboxypeptidase family protein [Ruminococcus sp.]|nr:D-alanyl-D-alanine carboxypeptidase family protein [Ruminococcus sp.]